jgi:dTDP-4-dehydrorhamnose reductase
LKILLTGKNGQVGFELLNSLQGLGELVAPDRSQLDLSDLDQLRSTIRSVKPDLIVNPAAYTAVDKAENEAELAMRINGEAPGVMAQEAARLGAAMIHYSTDYVFDGRKQTAYGEDDAPAPMSVYGRSKLAGEQAVAAAGIPHLILRTSWVYGVRGNNFMLTMLRLARERDQLRVVDDQHGAPTWSRTIAGKTGHILRQLSAEAGLAKSMAPHSGIYHLTAQGSTSWHGFAETIVAQAKLDKKPQVLPISTKDYPTLAARPANSRMDCSKLTAVFGPLPQWREALVECMHELPG